MSRFDIRRQVGTLDTTLGGVTITTTAIETREIDLQPLRGTDILALGGRRIEAQYRGFCSERSTILERDIITDNSGATKYEVTFVETLWPDHVEFFAKKAE